MDVSALDKIMGAYETMFQVCYDQLTAFYSNRSAVITFCQRLTQEVVADHQEKMVLDFEEVAPVAPAWWINGLVFVVIFSMTSVFNLTSIYIFFTASMRSPTNVVLAVISALDLLTCIFQVPVNVHAYLLEYYRELPATVWCDIYNYLHNFLPSAFHSAAFLLNMYLSVQRCVGVKDIKRCKVIGTYKGVLVAIVICTLVSFSIHSMHPFIMGVVYVQSYSKKMLLTGRLQYIDSCSVVPRDLSTYDEMFSAYLWLRVAVVQTLPALVLCACNIVLIRASYTTYLYRKRLVGAMGAITGFSQTLTSDVTIASRHRVGSSSSDAVNGWRDNEESRRTSSGDTVITNLQTDTSSHRNSSSSGLIYLLNRLVHHRGSSIGVMPSREGGGNSSQRSSCVVVGRHLAAENSSMKYRNGGLLTDPDSEVITHSEADSGVITHFEADSEILSDAPSTLGPHLSSVLEADSCGDDGEVSSRIYDHKRTGTSDLDLRGTNDLAITGTSVVRMSAYLDPTDTEVDEVRRLTQERSGRGGSTTLSDAEDESMVQITRTWQDAEDKERVDTQSSHLEDVTSRIDSANSCKDSDSDLKDSDSSPKKSPSSHKNSVTNSSVPWCDILREHVVTHDNLSNHRQELSPPHKPDCSSDIFCGEEHWFQQPESIHIRDYPVIKIEDVSSNGVSTQDTYNSSTERDCSSKRASKSESKKLTIPNIWSSKSQTSKRNKQQINEVTYRSSDHANGETSHPVLFGRRSTTSQLSSKLSFHRMSAELRSSVMLILVTSCTLIAEIFVIILLIFKFFTSVVYPHGQFMTHTQLATLIMISNIVTIVTFPLNFLFFWGLSHAFRSKVRAVRQVLTRVCNRQSI